MNRKTALFLTLLAYCTVGHAAEAPDWFSEVLAKGDPNQLAFYAGVHKDCPINREELNSLVEGVLIRSRIKPSDDWSTAIFWQ